MIFNSADRIRTLTPQYEGERLPDGRPCVQDDILERMKLVTNDEAWGVIDFRKHVVWYIKGFSVGFELRVRLVNSSTLAELAGTLAEVDQEQSWPAGADGFRGRTSGNNQMVLPEGWLNDPYDCARPSEDAESDTSGK